MRLEPGTILGGLLFTWALLAVDGCGPCPVEERTAATPAKIPIPEAEPEAPPIRLQPAAGSGILILEDGGDAAWRQEQAPADEELSGRPTPSLPAVHQGFRDHHVILYVPDPAAGLENALQAAAATGGRVISYLISGFEDLGPDERTLVFEARIYQSFLQRLRAQGETVYSEIGPSDFVTVRLTVKEKK